MTPQEFLHLATRLANDMKAWSEEATRLESLTTDELAALHDAAGIIDRVTVTVVARGVPPSAPDA